MSWSRAVNSLALAGAITLLLVCLFRLRLKENEPQPFIDIEQELANLQVGLIFWKRVNFFLQLVRRTPGIRQGCGR